MDHDHNMRNAHDIPLYHVIAKSSLSTSFLIACSSANETVGLPGWSRVEHGKLTQDISSRLYLRVERYDNYVKRI